MMDEGSTSCNDPELHGLVMATGLTMVTGKGFKSTMERVEGLQWKMASRRVRVDDGEGHESMMTRVSME